MNTIDLTTKHAALSFLRGLSPSTQIDLPGAYDPTPNSPAAQAVAVIADESPKAWARSMNRWEWTAGELCEAILVGRMVFVPDEGMEAEILKIHSDGDLYLRFEDGEEGSYELAEVDL